MQLSKFNKLIKFLSVHSTPDGYGGFIKEFREAFQLFGSLSATSVDAKGRKKYQITIDSRDSHQRLNNTELLVEYNYQRFIIKKILIDKNITKIECYDHQNTEDFIRSDK